MESKYINLVINRLTQAQYDELKRKNQIKEEEIYNIVDHDDLFYYKTELYTKSEIETKLNTVLSTLRQELSTEKETLSALVSSNTTQINSLRTDLVSNVNSLTSKVNTANTNLSDYKITVSNKYATKQELSEYSPVEANPELSGSEPVLESIEIDGTNYKVFPSGEVEFDTVQSLEESAVLLGSIKIGNEVWNIPTGSVDLSNYYTKSETYDRNYVDRIKADFTNNYYNKDIIDGKLLEVDSNVSNTLKNYYTKAEVDIKITDAVTSGQVDLSNYYNKNEVDALIEGIDVSDQLTQYALKTELPTLTSQLTNDSGFLTEHQSLEGYAKESYVDQKVYQLVGSTPEALDTLHELANALGNNPNFATTITTELSKKANSTSVYDKSQVYTKTEVDASISNVENEFDNYYTKSEVDSAISNVEIDLSGYYTKEETYNKSEVDTLVSNVEVDLSGYYTKDEIDSKDFTNVSANPTITGSEKPLSSISIKGVNYIIPSDEADNSLILSDTPVEGAANLASVTINGDSWNIVGSGGGGGGSLNPEDLADYYTKSEVNAEIRKVIGAAPQAYDTLKEIADYIESDLTNTSAMLASIATKANSADVYTKSEANGKFALKSDIPEKTDLTNYYTKDETLAVVDKITGLDNYYDKGEIDSKVETLNATKQDTLVSGSNIKTINGVSIVGAGNILINEGNSGGTPVQANPVLTGDELELTAIAIDNVNYTLPAGDMVFSESVVEDQKTLKTIMIDGDIWSIEKGSTLLANYPLTGDEQPLESVKIDDTVFTLKGEEMLFYENELPGAVPLKTIVINGDPWYVGGISETYVDEKIAALINAAPETLDTIGELAAALQDNTSVIETLNAAITNKADRTEIVKSYNDLTNKPEIPNIVFSETEPENPVVGMIWLKPV